eukprot:m.49698 g.49698  ORF g.49698 m.49698 type:complete len:336 (-) comp15339_c0_seq5:170-1177(-)
MGKSDESPKVSMKAKKKSSKKEKKEKKSKKVELKEVLMKDAGDTAVDTGKPAPAFVFGAPVAVTDSLIAEKYSSADAEAIRRKQEEKRLIADKARATASVARAQPTGSSNFSKTYKDDGTTTNGDTVLRKSSKSDRERTQRTIFVGNLPVKTRSKTVEKLFKPFGKIEAIRFRSIGLSALEKKNDETISRAQAMKTRNKQQGGAESSVNAYVVYLTPEEARHAVQETGGSMEVDGRHLRIDMAGGSKKHDNQHSVFVGNVPYTVSDEDLRQFFADCGDIKSVRVVRDPLTSIGRTPILHLHTIPSLRWACVVCVSFSMQRPEIAMHRMFEWFPLP